MNETTKAVASWSHTQLHPQLSSYWGHLFNMKGYYIASYWRTVKLDVFPMGETETSNYSVRKTSLRRTNMYNTIMIIFL